MLAFLLSGGSGDFTAATKLIMVTWQNGTKKKYSTYIKKWQNFCTQRQINHIQPPVVPVLDFLTALYQQGLTYNAVNTARNTCLAMLLQRMGHA